MCIRSYTAVTAVLAVCSAGTACDREDPTPSQTLEVVSDLYTIDRTYKSMEGPEGWVQTAILPEAPPELVWVTGYRAEVVAADGKTLLPPEFMCHSNLSHDAVAHARRFGRSKLTANRLFTVSQGQPAVTFPEGFGIPMMSDEVLSVHTQALNHNLADTTFQVRVRVSLEFVKQRDLAQPLRPLRMKSANALVLLEGDDGYYGTGHADAATHGQGSREGMAASGRVIRDPYGRSFSGHWVVPPGRQETTTLVTNWMRLTSDANLHYVAVHLHPFATSLALRDITTGTDVFTAEATGYQDRIGLAHVSTYADGRGITLEADHEYELRSVYDNPTGRDLEAMAVMYLYLEDPEFRLPPHLDDK